MTNYAYIEPPPQVNDLDMRRIVPAGQAMIVRPRGAPWTIGVSPGRGGTVIVEVTVSPTSIDPDAALWHALSPVAGDAGLTLYGFDWPVAGVRVQALSAPAVVERLP